MKLTDLAAPQPSKQIAKVFESYFGSKIKFDQLNNNQTSFMLKKVQGLLSEHRNSSARHFSERNPAYLQLVMIEQALTSRLNEQAMMQQPGQVQPNAQAGLQSAQVGQQKRQAQDQIKQIDMEIASLQKRKADLQKQMNNPVMTMAENARRRGRRLTESEVQQAQVVMAAQDMVDTMQGMLEDISELQFKELPALVDSIKNQVGIDQAQQFNTDATAALTGLLQNIQGAKQQLDAALGVVTGQAPAAAPGADMAAAGADMSAAAGDMAAAGADIGDDLGGEVDDLDAAAAAATDEIDEPVGRSAALGRAKR